MKYLDIEFKLLEKITIQQLTRQLHQFHKQMSWIFLEKEQEILGCAMDGSWCYEYTFNVDSYDKLKITISKNNEKGINQTPCLDFIQFLFDEGYVYPLEHLELFDLIRLYSEIVEKKEALQMSFEENKHIKENVMIPILFKPDFEEFYENEINDVLISILENASVNSYERKVLDEILCLNSYLGERKEHIENIQRLMKEPLNQNIIDELKKEGIYIYGGNHLFCTFYENPKYQLVIAKSNDSSVLKQFNRLILKHYF